MDSKLAPFRPKFSPSQGISFYSLSNSARHEVIIRCVETIATCSLGTSRHTLDEDALEAVLKAQSQSIGRKTHSLFFEQIGNYHPEELH